MKSKSKWVQRTLLIVMAVGMALASLKGQAAADCPFKNMATSMNGRFDNSSNYYRFIASQPKTPAPFKSMPLKAKGRQ